MSAVWAVSEFHVLVVKLTVLAADEVQHPLSTFRNPFQSVGLF